MKSKKPFGLSRPKRRKRKYPKPTTEQIREENELVAEAVAKAREEYSDAKILDIPVMPFLSALAFGAASLFDEGSPERRKMSSAGVQFFTGHVADYLVRDKGPLVEGFKPSKVDDSKRPSSFESFFSRKPTTPSSANRPLAEVASDDQDDTKGEEE